VTRQLTVIELQEIRKAIMRKEISSAEILMEVYVHYISHLKEFSEEGSIQMLILYKMIFWHIVFP